MAEILPKGPVGPVSPEIGKIFRRIKAIPGDAFRCRWALPVGDEKRPEFLIICRERFGFLLAVSGISQSTAEEIIEPTFSNVLVRSNVTIDNFGAAEEDCLRRFASGQELSLPNLARIILFPNVPQVMLDRIHEQKKPSFIFLGKESLVGTGFGLALEGLATRPMEPEELELARKAFSPELIIPRQIVGAVSKTRNVSAGLTESLLDLDQEHAMKVDMALSEEGEAAMLSNSLRLITGVAGSGKTLVLLHRAALYGKLEPHKRQIILTHNKPLTFDLQRRLQLLTKSHRSECLTFFSWCGQQLRGLQLIQEYERESKVRRAASKVSKAEAFPLQFLCDEIQWLKDYEKDTLPAYLEASRVGRGRSLNEPQRRTVFAVYQEYQQNLTELGKEDWSGLPLMLLKKARENQIKLPRYDYVFVDEAQFFAPIWLKLMQMIVHPEGGQLVLSADPTQGFLKRRESWSASGLNVRGRTIKLERAYRNTRCILEYAAAFYRKRLPEDEEEINLPEPERIAEMPTGKPPEELSIASKQDEITRVCNEVQEILRAKVNPADILVILSKGRVDEMVNALNHIARQIVAGDAKQGRAGLIRVCSINAATGLEAPIVFVLGVSQLLEDENSFQLSEEDRREKVRDNTRKLYMAFTRATQKLVVLSCA